MPRVSAQKVLPKLIGKMLSDRRKHQARIAKLQVKVDAINAIFADAGIEVTAPAGGRKAGRPKGAKTAKRRKRGTFATTAAESVLAFVKKKGSPATTDIRRHWASEGRGGQADSILTILVKQKMLKRLKDPAVRGSRYKLA